MKFHNPKLASAFENFDKACTGLYTDYEQMAQDILALETYLQDKPIPKWKCHETGIEVGFYGERRRIMVMNEKAGEARPLQDSPAHVRLKLVPMLPIFIENLTKNINRISH